MLKRCANALPCFLRGWFAKPAIPSACGVYKIEYHAKGSCLAAAIWPENSEYFALVDGQIKRFNSMDLPVVLCEGVYLEDFRQRVEIGVIREMA